MGDFHIKPGTPEELVHYGVKGMRWGVRKERELTGREAAAHNEETKAWIAARNQLTPLTGAAAQANFAQNQQKFAAKFAPSEPGSSGWDGLSDGQKKALMVAAGVGAYIGVSYAAQKYLEGKQDKALADLMDKFDELDKLGLDGGDDFTSSPTPDWVEDIQSLAGQPIDPKKFEGLVAYSQGNTWYGGDYTTDKAFARPEYEIPAGHEFHRISTKPNETDFNPTTYSTHSIEDYNRYVAGFSGEKFGAQLHHVTWTSTEPVKVPNLTTVLGSLHKVMQEDPLLKGATITQKDVLDSYNAMSGGSWESHQSVKLVESLKAQGYGAIVDEMDAGVIGATPVIFFAHENATPKKSTPIDKKAIKEAHKALIEIENPPGRKP